MSQRSYDLIRHLRQGGPKSPAELAMRFDVSERTVRTDVQEANRLMRGSARIARSRNDRGRLVYDLIISDEQALGILLARAAEVSVKRLPTTPAERVSYLIDRLLLGDDWVTLDELSEQLHVSRASISGDLKGVEAVLTPFGLTLERRPRYGIRVQGPEMSRRRCLAEHLSEKDDGGRPTCFVERIADAAWADCISACVNEAIRNEKYEVNPDAYENLLAHVAVMLARVRGGSVMPMAASQLEAILQTREYAVASRLAELIEQRMGIALPAEEKAYVAVHLAGKRTLPAGPDDEGDGGLIISDEVWDTVSEMIDVVWHAYRFDFRNDLELRMNLARHLVPLEVRLKYHMKIRNPLLDDTKAQFALAYSMALDASSVLAEKCGSPLSEDEVGYIALSFALALERLKTSLPKKRVLIVCASGAGSAKLLEYRYLREFGDYIDDIRVCNVRELDSVDYGQVDYVFTTVPLSRKLPVPVREITYFLDSGEVGSVRRMLARQDDGEVVGYFDERLFFPHARLSEKREILRFLCERVGEIHETSGDLIDLVLRREEAVSTSFGNNVAMPHPLEAVSDENFVAVCVLDEPVVWDEYGRTVQLVFLISVTGNASIDFYGSMAELLMSKKAVEELICDQRWETLVSLLESFDVCASH